MSLRSTGLAILPLAFRGSQRLAAVRPHQVRVKVVDAGPLGACRRAL